MFPLQQISSDRMIHFSSINSNQPNRIPQDLILAHASMDGTSVRSSDDIKGKDRRRKLLATLDDKNFATPTTTTNQGNQKETHRDIERERRKQMTALYTLLRSLIPHEFIRGKRSISDHMNEAVNYIKHLQMRIKGLDAQRDELKKLSNLNPSRSSSSTGSGSLINKCSETWVSIQPCPVGIEIVVSSSSSMGQGYPLSIILQLLLEQGLILVSCINTKVNERTLYTIQSEVSDQTSTNFSQLQQNLIQAISSGIQSSTN